MDRRAGEIFDRIVLTTDAGRKELTVDEFVSIPLLDRVRYLMEARVAFFLGEEAVVTREALSSIRRKAVE